MFPQKNAHWTIATLAFAATFAVGAWYFWWTQPLQVPLTTTTYGPMESYIEEDGKTRLKDRYIVSAPLFGTLVRIGLKPGDTVEAGKTTLATLHPTAPSLLDARQRAQAEARKKIAELSVEQAKSNLNRVRVMLDLAEKNYGRANQLIESKSISQQEFDLAQSDFRSQKAAYAVAAIAESIASFELEQAEAALLHIASENNKDNSIEFSVTSPISGRILRVFQESAAVVQHGTPLMEVGDPLNIEIECDVLSSDAVKIREGNMVVILRWGGEHPLHGKVRRIEPSAFTKVSALGVEEQRVNVVIDIEEPSESRSALGDAFRVETRIIYWSSERVLRIPASALFREGSRWCVFRVRRGMAHTTEIAIGHRNQDFVEILDGLVEGDTVVKSPSDEIRDGIRVAPVGR